MKEEHNFYELAKTVEYPEEEIKRIIEVFSVYLNMSNRDYKYNEPYLNKYTQNFCNILLSIKDKHPAFDKLGIFLYNKYNSYLHDKDKIKLVIDGFWEGVVTNGNFQATQCSEVDWNKVCSKRSKVKCIYLKNSSNKHIFISDKYIVLNNKLSLEAIEEIEKEFDFFLEKHLTR